MTNDEVQALIAEARRVAEHTSSGLTQDICNRLADALSATLPREVQTVEELDALAEAVESVRWRYNSYDLPEATPSMFIAKALAKFGYRLFAPPQNVAPQ